MTSDKQPSFGTPSKRDTLTGYTDESNLELITFYRNTTPILAAAYLDLKKKYEESAQVIFPNADKVIVPSKDDE